MVEFAAHYPWLIPALPLLAAVVIGLLGWKARSLMHVSAILAMLGSFVLAIALVVGLSTGTLSVEALRDVHVFNWFAAGNFRIEAAVTIDQLTAIYLSFITGIGLLIFIYSAAYMKGDFGFSRFFAYLSLFVFFMTCLVMANNFVLLYLGWEGVGLASYLLIGYYYPRPTAVAAAKKAFITNRVGDFGLAIGIFLIYRYFGSLDFSNIFGQLHDAGRISSLSTAVKWIPFCLMIGAFGKSAQFPLHVWLPDAMEGPTPVSALIHAATMVTAGIYLIARTMPLFLMDPNSHLALNIVAIVGGFTAFLAASIALCQYDLKKIWAYSTVSQLGYMFLALGVMASTSAVFHVFTHAFFKALLFLAAGSVMHAMGGELDIRKMSGIRRVMPITNAAMLIGCLALAGFPGFSGYFSKDEIISHAINAPQGPGFYLGILAFIVALMTAFYTFRLYFRVFTGPLELPATAGHHERSPFAVPGAIITDGVDTVHGKQGHEEASHGEDAEGQVHQSMAGHSTQGHGEGHGPNDGSPMMWIPLLLLCIGAIGAGYLGFGKTGDWFHRFLNPALAPAAAVSEVHPEGNAAAVAANGEMHAVSTQTGLEAAAPAERVSESVLLVLGIAIPLIGIAGAFYFYKHNRHAADIVGANFRPLVNFLYNKWYIDELYRAIFIMPLWVFSHACSLFDRYIVEGLVFIISFLPAVAGYTLRPMQRGVLQRYAVGMIAGVAAIVLAVMYLLH